MQLSLVRALRRFAVVGVIVLATLALTSVAFANVPLTTVSQDPYTNANTDVFHQTQVEPDTFA